MPNAESPDSPLKIALQVLTAAAGFGALITFVGGVTLWLRFDKLDLAADQALTLLPKQLLVVIGAHALLGPVIFAAVAALLLGLIGSPKRAEVSARFKIALAVVVVIAIGVAFALVMDFDVFPEQLIVYVAIILGSAVIWLTARRSVLRRHIAQVVLIVFIVCGALLAIVRTVAAPQMEPVAVLLKGDKAVNGFYVGQTSDRVYIAPLPGLGDPGDPFADAQIDRVVELSRDDVVRMALQSPASIAPDGSGRHQAQALLADLRVQNAGVRKPADEQIVTTVSPETAFAPLVHLDARERAYPMSADTFLRNSWLMWAHDGCPPYSVALDDHVKDPASRRAQIMGRFDALRLGGANAYEHVPADAGCRDQKATFTAAEYTRAFDATGRPEGLPLKEGFYLDLWDKQRYGQKRVKKEGAQRVLSKTPVYFERSQEEHEGRDALRITYWLFYGLSIPPGPESVTELVSHEGDWERVSVLLANGPEPGQYIPISARYHYHDESRDVPWSVVDRVGLGSDQPTHPVVFSARGSHASYPRAGRYENVFKVAGRRRFAVYDIATACPDCPQWRAWQLLLDAKAQPWYGFGGAWGRVGSIAGTTGPLGPSKFKIRGLGPAPENAIDNRRPTPTATAKR